LIWKRSRRAYYRPDARGYTEDPAQAGRFSRDFAEREAAVEPGNFEIRPAAPSNHGEFVTREMYDEEVRAREFAVDRANKYSQSTDDQRRRAEAAEAKVADLERRYSLTRQDCIRLAVALAQAEAERDRMVASNAALVEELWNTQSERDHAIVVAEDIERDRDRWRNRVASLQEALHVIATQSNYEWSETRSQLHEMIDAMREVARAALVRRASPPAEEQSR
jgi:hypothetical protein